MPTLRGKRGQRDQAFLSDQERAELFDSIARKLRSAAERDDPKVPSSIARAEGPYNPAANVADLFRGKARPGSKASFEAARFAQVLTARNDYGAVLERVTAARLEDRDAQKAPALLGLLHDAIRATEKAVRDIADLKRIQGELLLAGIDRVVGMSSRPAAHRVRAADVETFLAATYFALQDKVKSISARIEAIGVGRGGNAPKREERARFSALKDVGLTEREIAATALGILIEVPIPIRRDALTREDRRIRSLLDRARSSSRVRPA